ncbi:hypothetical protein PRMUPPPA20_08760 [Xylanibacter ruminicola]|uniref:Conserved domain protein n=2 Tax=Xylanibacter ruminicola TaxID=839 RepID=D5EWX5_XYLR2|nr:hypothetical protein [Xylanibacter ruminicola]ADE81728.1 conserved domain protein [Xylanibacter ruminicola 23]GJG32767.1 hypothetical protein PRMUPPPA20_08760 [Xylanibacter ruminicola]SEH95356.1 hypothetical protein SAMN02745192_2448 [Xylanibacter ruminicola]
MKYKFQVVIPLTYSDKNIEVEADFTDEEATQIKEVIANNAERADESLLPLLSDETPELYDKFWDAIFHPLFLELLIDGMNNYGNDIKLDEDDIEDYREADFDKVFDMYGDSIEIDPFSDCKCKIPKEWLPK